MQCSRCKSEFTGPGYKQGKLTFCDDCWEQLTRLKLNLDKTSGEWRNHGHYRDQIKRRYDAPRKSPPRPDSSPEK
jgi:hypothetical protein